MKTRNLLLLVVVIAIVTTGVTLLGRATAKNDGLTVGVILPLTGILAEMGKYERDAMILAAEELATEGIPLHLIIEDGQGDNKVVAAAANRLLSVDGVDILVTSTTGASLTAKPIANDYGTLHMAFCMSSQVVDDAPCTIRPYIGIEEESDAIVGFLSSLPPETRVGVLHGAVAAWTVAMEEIYEPFFRDHFTEPVVIEQYEIRDRNVRAQIAKLKNAGVTVLVVLGYGFEYDAIFNELKEKRLHRELTDIVGGWGFLYAPLPDDDLEGVAVAGPQYVFTRGEVGSDFERRFHERFGYYPNFDAAFAYETVRTIPSVWHHWQDSEASSFKQVLAAEGTRKGAVGEYRYDDRGNMIVLTGVGHYRDGVVVGTEN